MSRRAFTIIAACTAILVPGAGAALAAPSHHVASSATKITVTATEFKFKLSKTSAHKGSVTFKLVNKGHLPHDFRIDGKTTPVIARGKSASITVKFAKAGKFPYLCTVPGHAAAGMKGSFTVR